MIHSSHPTRLSAAILAGGKAQRLKGLRKGEIRTPDGIPIIKKITNALRHAQIRDIVIISNLPYHKYHPNVITDLRKNLGPIGGIETALNYFKHKTDATLLLPCDVPNISPTEINKLKNHFLSHPELPVVYAQSKDHRNHPLFAIIRNDNLPLITQMIDKGERKVSNAWQTLNGHALYFKNQEAFLNINTLIDLDEWLKTTS